MKSGKHSKRQADTLDRSPNTSNYRQHAYGTQVISNLMWFYFQVDHRQPWDIKVPQVWYSTIGTNPPGVTDLLYFRGYLMTREEMGNFTYGYIGNALGLSLNLLIGGSVFAARNRLNNSDQVLNELDDWFFIAKGFNAFRKTNYICGQ